MSSQVSSPSSVPSSGYQDAWDTLYAAAGEVVRLKMNEEKKVAVYPNERISHSKVLNPSLRAQLPQQTRPSGQMAGRRSPHSTRRKDENLVSMNQVLKVASVVTFFSHCIFDSDALATKSTGALKNSRLVSHCFLKITFRLFYV